MNSHLTREQIDRLLIGDRVAEHQKHVAACEQCAKEVARMEAPLAALRGAVHAWSARQMSPAAVLPRSRFSGSLRTAMAAGALVIAVAVGIEWRNHYAAEMTRADDALLRQVDSEVAQSVPSSLEPLANLMNISTTEGNSK